MALISNPFMAVQIQIPIVAYSITNNLRTCKSYVLISMLLAFAVEFITSTAAWLNDVP